MKYLTIIIIFILTGSNFNETDRFKISNNNNTKQIIDLHSQINKNMHLAHVVNLNKSDVLIASLKELSGT